MNDTIDFRDRYLIGRTDPDFSGGFSTNLSWKGFSIFAQFDFAIGHVIVNMGRQRNLAQVQGRSNGPVEILDSWTEENRDTDVPRYDFIDPQNNHSRNARYVENGDYLCVRELSLSYDLPTNFIQPYVNKANLFISATNLKYFTDYTGVNPEAGGSDYGRYPMPRRVVLGLNISF
jgi:hypothetical protein